MRIDMTSRTRNTIAKAKVAVKRLAGEDLLGITLRCCVRLPPFARTSTN